MRNSGRNFLFPEQAKRFFGRRLEIYRTENSLVFLLRVGPNDTLGAGAFIKNGSPADIERAAMEDFNRQYDAWTAINGR